MIKELLFGSWRSMSVTLLNTSSEASKASGPPLALKSFFFHPFAWLGTIATAPLGAVSLLPPL
jgi:hypothetical protein